eukprot:NODE_1176_length_1850_cov_30.537348_g1116_i0.p1 GENE.NODE_1176_length_1850_cov_30.537348_g1116_i0~~NODE_1176_length_1850_cov_30.537348_g1116_i0.p1  ORF type:complete len:429 (+),score=53.65 NODE_1176_length_1850_cov_30.537348_g1116_i0:79-1365(+)
MMACSFQLASLLFLLLPTLTNASVNVFIFGDYVTDHPVGTFIVTFMVIVISVILELLMHSLHNVKNRYTRLVIEHVLTELKMLGIISLSLVFIINVIGPSQDKILLFDWAHMVLFVFAMLLMMFVSTLFGTIKFSWRKWVRYEKDMMSMQTEEEIQHTLRKQHHQKFFLVLRKFKNQAMAINPEYKNLSFCRYLKKNQRQNLVVVIELNWKSWTALTLMAGINSFRGYVMSLYETNGDLHAACLTNPPCTHDTFPWNVIVFICVGFLPVIVFYALVVHLMIGFNKFLGATTDIDAEQGKLAKPLLDHEDLNVDLAVNNHNNYFWFGNPAITLQLVQILMLYVVYYTTLLIMSMIYECTHAAQGAIWLLVGLAPILCFYLQLPNCMQMLSILASTGNLLDTDILEEMYQKDLQGKGDDEDEDDHHARHH